MADEKDFIEEAKQVFSSLSLETVPVDPDLKRIDAEGGSIELDVYTAEKIEKVVFCTITIHANSVSEKSVLVWPAEGYDLPIAWCNQTGMSGMNIPIFDFVPTMDLVMWPQYAEKYMTVLNDARKNSVEVFKDTITDKAFDMPSRVAHVLSPYKLIMMVSDEGAQYIPEVMSVYGNAYMGCWEKAEPLQAGEERDFCIRKKEAVRKLMKENDPGYPFMVDVFGEEKTNKVFDHVF